MKRNFTKVVMMLAFLMMSLNASAQTELWGVASSGGTLNGGGVIFKIQLDGSGYTVVYRFGDDTAKGVTPPGSLLNASNGLFYGVCQYGGANNYGCLFSFDPQTLIYTDIYDWPYASYGILMDNLVEDSHGNLYGVSGGGCSFGGYLFKYDPASNSMTILYNFYSTNSEIYRGPICLNDKLYGMTENGGLNLQGSLYCYDLATDSLTIIHNSSQATGCGGWAHLYQANDGKLYGLLESGGISGGGVLFSFDITTNTFADLLGFNVWDGNYPINDVIQLNNGELAGLTMDGGNNDEGVLFAFNQTTNQDSVLYSFYSNGIHPQSGLIQASNGMLYGTTPEGGTINDYGIVFRYDLSAGTYEDIFDFDDYLLGVSPQCTLVETPVYYSDIPVVIYNETVSIYPNPATTLLTIRLSQSTPSPTQLIITDLLGTEVYTQPMPTATESTLDISKLSNGIYFYEVRSSNEVARGKFVVQK